MSPARFSPALNFRFLFSACLLLMPIASVNAQAKLELKPNDHICYIGNTTADRMQHHAWLETYIHALHPNHKLTFRNLGFSGDEIVKRQRSANFGSADQWLTKCKADVVFCFFGYNEALRGPDGLADYQRNLVALIKQMKDQKYNGKSAPQIVFFSPLAHENLKSPHLPDGADNNANLKIYAEATKKICADASVPYVDLFFLSGSLYQKNTAPMTMNGIHLLDGGNKILAQALIPKLFAGKTAPADNAVAKLRKSVLDKNYYWFSRYRVVDGYNVFGGRSKLAWFGQSNADVMMREMEIFDVMTANRDAKVWAIAAGGDLEVKDDNIPEQLVVKRNKVGPLNDGGFPYLDPEEAISKMTVHKNMKVNLFASEKMFPRLVNPVQMSVGPDSRLWVSSWESYPHWNPSLPRKDSILIFPDEDGDGVADECQVFADQLNSVTGFEFWGGGILVAAPPEIWFLKDTDGDDKADVRIRMLQGLSSADSHHSANSMLLGPDGWLYFSRGIFNVAAFETPTKTYRSGKSGVHRFNPRTFEVDFHFPIGPNPHGDVFDQWGYQFANDGTGGTGSYINIGKGIGNKKWFKKRVRPVPANGILSSSHFPPENDGSFLITNAIGFLGVLQHKVNYDGADITATEIEPIMYSEDPNFRPSDVEVGGDGALYIADWHNALIGHMQHNMRDPNRDHTHGRVYRVTYNGRPLVKPLKLKGKPIAEVLTGFFARENNSRYRARLELSGRKTSDVVAGVKKFADGLDPANDAVDRNEAQALMECLWVLEEHRAPQLELIQKTFQAKEPRVRAAAIRTLGHWTKIKNWQPLLLAAAKDRSALVRAEAVKSAVNFDEAMRNTKSDIYPSDDATALEAVFEAGARPLDAEMNTVLNYAKKTMKINSRIAAILKSGTLSPAATAYVLANGTPKEILELPASRDVFQRVLAHPSAKLKQLRVALSSLAGLENKPSVKLLIDMINSQPPGSKANLVGMGQLLSEQPPSELANYQADVEKLAKQGATSKLKQIGFANWIALSGADDPFLFASKAKPTLKDFLESVVLLNPAKRTLVFDKVKPLIFELPNSMKAEVGEMSFTPGIKGKYFTPHSKSAKSEVIDTRAPLTEKTVKAFRLMVPAGQTRDKFTNVFESNLSITKAGKYTFFVKSDDGSMLYLDGKPLINNDGDHGPTEVAGRIELGVGRYPIRVNYFNSSGGNSLRVYWKGPGIKKQEIPIQNLFVGSAESLHDIAVRSLGTIPGKDREKFAALSSLVALGRNQTSAIGALQSVAADQRIASEIPTLLNNVIGYLSEMPASQRTSPAANDAIEFAKSLAGSMPDKQKAAALDRLKNLDIRVIAIGTVPHRMIYDKEMLVVEAGKTIEFRFSNTDSMPHNFAVVAPGSLATIGELAEATGRDADAAARHYIPASRQVLVGSKLLQPGQEQAISFEVPSVPGVYPYVCTYPGHWRRMYGALYVVPSFEAYQRDQKGYLEKLALTVRDELLQQNSRGQEWKYDDLIADVSVMKKRSFEVGEASFKAANCVACHQFGGQGVNFGPDLAKLTADKKTTAHILRSILEPSKDIDAKFASTKFLMVDGTMITGMVTSENDDVIKVIVDPLAKDKETELPVDDVDESQVSAVSPMPAGMIDKLSREEIIDLMAYILSGAEKKHKYFEGHDHGH